MNLSNFELTRNALLTNLSNLVNQANVLGVTLKISHPFVNGKQVMVPSAHETVKRDMTYIKPKVLEDIIKSSKESNINLSRCDWPKGDTALLVEIDGVMRTFGIIEKKVAASVIDSIPEMKDLELKRNETTLDKAISAGFKDNSI